MSLSTEQPNPGLYGGGNDEEEPELSNKNKGKETAQDNSQENDNVSNEGTRLHDNQQTTILKETTRIEKGEKDKKDRNAAIVEKKHKITSMAILLGP